MIPLFIDDRLVGGELEIFAGPSEAGLARHAADDHFDDDEIVRIGHRTGYSIVGQLMRLMHRVAPISRGSRITLNLNLRSLEQPYIDDNSMYYLAADNPSLDFVDEYVTDLRERQLPAFVAKHAA
jgi:hypothetical protein